MNDEKLILSDDGRYLSKDQCLIAGTDSLRELVSAQQLAKIFVTKDAGWASSEIKHNSPFHKYLIKTIEVKEIKPDEFLNNLNKTFLEAQSDEWIQKLYEFLSDQKNWINNNKEKIAVIRIQDRTHTVASKNGKTCVYLPGEKETDFPTVKAEVCESDKAKLFFTILKILPATSVDDVLQNILPKISQATNAASFDIEEYKNWFIKILDAYNDGSISSVQKKEFTENLKNSSFVLSTDPSGQTKSFQKPDNLYLNTGSLRELLCDLEDVFFVDENNFLNDTSAKILLKELGAVDYLRWKSIITPISEMDLTTEEKDKFKDLRFRNGCSKPDGGKNHKVEGTDIPHLSALFLYWMTHSNLDNFKVKSKVLWDNLLALVEANSNIFKIIYFWDCHGTQENEIQFSELPECVFDFENWQRYLNNTPWILNESGTLQSPDTVYFDSLEKKGWNGNPLLLDKIKFKLRPTQREIEAKEELDRLRKQLQRETEEREFKLKNHDILFAENQAHVNTINDLKAKIAEAQSKAKVRPKEQIAQALLRKTPKAILTKLESHM